MVDDSIFRKPKQQVETRWYTLENPTGKKGAGGMTKYGRKGSAHAPLKAGESMVLADITGSGTIRRIWVTLYSYWAQSALRGFKIEMYWDGAKTPAVQAPFGDFFCHTLGHIVPFENACFSSPEGRSFNCIVPMPFRKSARIVLTNESNEDNGIYYEVDATIGDQHDDDMLYFHSYWRRENYTKPRIDVAILPKVEGQGRFLGCNIGVRQNPACTNWWWGEGEAKIFVDGDTEYPTLVGTGAEDYAGNGFGLGLSTHLYQGTSYITEDKACVGFYRFHVPDPVYFYRDIRVEIQPLGAANFSQMLESLKKDPSLTFMVAGDGTRFLSREELEKDPVAAEFIEREDDYSVTAYWYMDRPENGFPPIAGVEERMKDLC